MKARTTVFSKWYIVIIGVFPYRNILTTGEKYNTDKKSNILLPGYIGISFYFWYLYLFWFWHLVTHHYCKAQQFNYYSSTGILIALKFPFTSEDMKGDRKDMPANIKHENAKLKHKEVLYTHTQPQHFF